MTAPPPTPLIKNETLRQLFVGVAAVAGVIAFGGVALWLVGGGVWRWDEALYEALIAVSTVGFGELPQQDTIPGARLMVAVVIILGLGAVALFQSTLTALLVEGTLGAAWRRRRMRKQIHGLSGHVVVAGVGSTGRHAVEELWATQTPFVAIDRSAENLERVSNEVTGGEMLYVPGDATEDQVLQAAGVERAAGLIAALTHDKDNLYVTLSARSLNPKARIVSKVVELEAVRKMQRAGANATVSPNIMGGRRMASELTRPELVQLLDEMLRDKDRNIRLEEVPIPSRCSWVGKTLGQLGFQKETHVFLVAVRDAQRNFRYGPTPEYVLVENAVLVVLGHEADVATLRARVASASA